MKILVTGATGFIGRHVLKVLLEKKHTIIASSARLEIAEGNEWFEKVIYIPFDLSAYDHSTDYFSYFQKPDRVIHLAWEGLPNYKADFHEKENLPGHYRFLSNLISHGLKDLTVTGTCFEYGMVEGCLSETMQVKPDNSYGRAKNQLRIQLEELKNKYDYRLKWVRLFYMYGEGQNPNSLLSQLQKALDNGETEFNMSGGEQVRDYLPVEKVASNIVAIALQDKVDGIINNCSGVPITINQFVDEYLKNINKQIRLNKGVYPYPDYEPMKFWGDNRKLKQILNNE